MSEISTKSPVLFSKIKGDDYDDGQVVMTIAGTITTLFEPKKGETYEYQNGKMKDSEGTEIEICFSKNSQPMKAKGKKLTIRSVKSETHGWNGIKVEDQSFTPKGQDEPVKKRVLKITASADITYDGGSQGKSSGTGGSSAAGSSNAKPAQNSDPHPDVFLQDIISLHMRCHHWAEQGYPGDDNKEIRQACTASLFIEACRSGIQHNFMERAAKPVPPKIAPPPKDPALWKTCMIPKGEMMGKTLNDLTDEQFEAFYDAMKDKDTAIANCVKAGYEERGLLKKRQEADAKAQEENQALAPEGEDDIPF